MSTMIEKLEYLKDTKDIFKEKLASIGQDSSTNGSFRNFLNWTNSLSEVGMRVCDFHRQGIKGESAQEGIPTQDTPVEIKCKTGETQYFGQMSTNYFNFEETVSKNVVTTYSDRGFYIDFSSSAAERPNERDLYFDYHEGEKYVVKIDWIGAAGSEEESFSLIMKVGNQILWNQEFPVYATSPAFAIPDALAREGKVTIECPSSSPGKYISVESIEIGPANVYSLDLGDLKLMSYEAEDVIKKDSLAGESEQWLKIGYNAEKVFNGTEEQWECTALGEGLYEMSIGTEGGKTYSWLLSNYFSYDWDDVVSTDYCTSKQGKFVFYTDKQTSVEDWKAWLTTHNLTVIYPVNKTVTAITDEDLISQLDNILCLEGGKAVDVAFRSFIDSNTPSDDGSDS